MSRFDDLRARILTEETRRLQDLGLQDELLEKLILQMEMALSALKAKHGNFAWSTLFVQAVHARDRMDRPIDEDMALDKETLGRILSMHRSSLLSSFDDLPLSATAAHTIQEIVATIIDSEDHSPLGKLLKNY